MKRAVGIIAAAVLLLMAAAIALPLLVNPNQYRPLVESKLSGALGRTVKIGDLKLEFTF